MGYRYYRTSNRLIQWEQQRYDNYRRGPRPERILPTLVDVLAGSGLRIGEVLALRWCDLDLESVPARLYVRGTTIGAKGCAAWRKPAPKTRAGERGLALPKFTSDSLLAWKVEQGFNPIDAVFPSRVGTWRSTHNARGLWRKFRTDMGVDSGITFKSYRKAIATLIHEESGMSATHTRPTGALAALSGHSIITWLHRSWRTTVRTYSRHASGLRPNSFP